MRKLVLTLMASLLLFASVRIGTAEAHQAVAWLDTTGLEKGMISVTYKVKAKVKTKLMITKGKESYTYNLLPEKKAEHFPLQLGNGEYKIYILENVSGNSYKQMEEQAVTLKLKDDKVIYLNSIQNVDWTSSSQAIVKAAELAQGKKADEDIVKAIHQFIITTISYDHKLAAQVAPDYLPSIDRTFTSQQDICYGYSALFAAMLRSLDIPTKLVMGNSDYVDIYHAWNEVYLNGEWVIIDTTVDAGLKLGNKKFELVKDASKYTAAKIY